MNYDTHGKSVLSGSQEAGRWGEREKNRISMILLVLVHIYVLPASNFRCSRTSSSLTISFLIHSSRLYVSVGSKEQPADDPTSHSAVAPVDFCKIQDPTYCSVIFILFYLFQARPFLLICLWKSMYEKACMYVLFYCYDNSNRLNNSWSFFSLFLKSNMWSLSSSFDVFASRNLWLYKVGLMMFLWIDRW